MDVTDDEQLSLHIRQLLFDYVVDHITTDYIQLTEQAVANLWGRYLTEIPTVDPNALVLPPDPFNTLTRVYALGTHEPFQETFQSTPSAIQCIRKLLSFQAEKPKSERVPFQESSSESHVPLYRPMSPILTARARRETPRPASNTFLRSLPQSHSEFLSTQAIQSVAVELISEPAVKQEDVLGITWGLRQDEHAAVRSLLRSAVAPQKDYKNRHLDFAARPDSPPLPSRVPDAPFIPIFSRRKRAGSGIREDDPPPSGLKGMQSLPAVILPPVKVEELEPELYKQNMVVVNGWQAIQSSPSPSPALSPASSQEEQIDELRWSSPDTTPPPARPQKMEVVLIPRIHRIGGQRNKPAPLGHGSSLGSFLKPLALKTSDEKIPPRPSPEAAGSMVGQADSTCDSKNIHRDDLDAEVGGLYGHQRQDPRDWILKEKIDEKRQLLMEVPALPPPNQHLPNELFLPSNLKEIVAPLKPKGQVVMKHPVHQFLKKAKGIPSLNVELSWVPIAAKTRIPTHAEVLEVIDFIQPCSDLSTQTSALLERTLSVSEAHPCSDTWSRRYRNTLFETTPWSLDLEVARCKIILTRKERRKAAALQDDVSDSDDPVDVEPAQASESRSAKRQKLSQEAFLDDSGVAFDFPDEQPYYGDDDPLAFIDGDKENLSPSFDAPHFDLPDINGYAMAEDDEQFIPLSPRIRPPSRLLQNSICDDYDHGEFMALSFDSVPAASAQPTQLPPNETPPDETYTSMFETLPDSIVNDTPIPTPSSESSMPLDAPDIATHSLGIFDFAKLRAKKVSMPAPAVPPQVPQVVANESFDAPSRDIPDEIYERNTIHPPSVWNPPSSLHRYMVSMELAHKISLMHCIRSRVCDIDLVERETLGGVDIIIDPHSAIIFANLLILPSECPELVQRIGQQSFSFSRLFIIFEAYAPECSHQSKFVSNLQPDLFAYTPPVLKAIGKFRRDLSIMEGSGDKRSECVVQHAFANSVDEAAMFTRYFGDFVEANDETQGMLWGDRTWLEDDMPEGEADLAAAEGMNRFAAFVILCQNSLEEFLEMSPEDRLAKFGACVGLERMISLNQVIEHRLQAMQSSESDMNTYLSEQQQKQWTEGSGG